MAKFLATHSESVIFSSLYSFAPDNLAWLWSFIDWDVNVDFTKIPNQETYLPFKPINEYDEIHQDQLSFINQVFLNSPFVQFKYRETLMIGDVYKFIEHIFNKEKELITEKQISSELAKAVAKYLFLLYFPRNFF